MLTGRQQEIWDYVVGYVDARGYPPTVREIGEAVGLASPSTVHAHLANLERAGLLRRDPTKPHARSSSSGARSAPRRAPARGARTGLPLVGEIAAGGPLLAEHTIEEYVTRSTESLSPAAMLRAPGQGATRWVNAGILDGDLRRRPQRQQDARERRDRGRARRQQRDRRRGDRQDVLPRARAASGSSPRTTPTSRSMRATSRSSAG